MPTIDIPDKICPCCGNTKWYSHGDRLWCSTKRLENQRNRWKNCDKKKYNEYRKTRRSYQNHLLKNKTKRREYRKLHPIAKKTPLTIAERSARYYAKVKDNPVYIEKNRVRAEQWLKKNSDKFMTSDRYARYQLGECTTSQQRENYIIYLKCLRLLKQLENENSSNINQKTGAH
jgi:hypothetical protein